MWRAFCCRAWTRRGLAPKRCRTAANPPQFRALDDEGHLADAQRASYWNFLFILGYSVGLALLLNWVARYRSKMTPGLIAYAVWGALLAGGCAVVENVSMLILIGRYPDHAYFGLIALLGTLFSLAKWTLLCASAGYTAVQIIVTADNWTARAQESLNAIVAWLRDRFRRRGPAAEPAVEPGGI
jgi:hypothetical protein